MVGGRKAMSVGREGDYRERSKHSTSNSPCDQTSRCFAIAVKTRTHKKIDKKIENRNDTLLWGADGGGGGGRGGEKQIVWIFAGRRQSLRGKVPGSNRTHGGLAWDSALSYETAVTQL